MSDYIFASLLVVHIIAIVGWMGAAFLFSSVLGPSLDHMEPVARSEFLVKVVPRYMRYIAMTSVLAVIFGVGLYAYAASSSALPRTGSSALLLLQAGAGMGLIALILAFVIVLPSGRTLTRLITEGRNGPPPQGQADIIIRTQQRMRMASAAISALLLLVLILMVLGATL